MEAPRDGEDWLGLTEEVLPINDVSAWLVRPDCGAVVVFSGVGRDHSSGRPGVHRLEYEAYVEHVVPRLGDIAERARQQWPDLGRLALIHRIGEIPVGESAVVVGASSPHRVAAFEAAKFGIDTLKETVPIWKREAWDGGESWGLEAQHIVEVADAANEASGSPSETPPEAGS